MLLKSIANNTVTMSCVILEEPIVLGARLLQMIIELQLIICCS